MFRRNASVSVASAAVVLAGLTFSAAPASAAVTGGTLTPTSWALGSSPEAVVTMTTSAAVTSPFVIVDWDWSTNNWPANGQTQTVTAGTNSFTCNGTGITFASDVAWGTPATACTFENAGPNPGTRKVTLTNAVSSGTANLTVTFPAGSVTAGANRTMVGTWTLPNSVQVRASVTSDSTTPPPPVTLEFDGNGGTCTPGSVTGEQGTWGTALTADKCTNGTKELAFFSTSPTAQIGAVNVAPGGPIFFLQDNRLYALWRSEVPSPPTNVVATPGQNAVTVSWTASASDGGDPIRGYSVRYKATTDANYRTFCITNPVTFQCTAALPATNTKYTFVVIASNQVGRSESVPSSPVSPYDLKDVTASRGDVLFGLGGTKVDANGAAPGLAGQALNVQYKVGSAEWTTVTNGVKVNAESRFSWAKRFPASANKKVVTVRFTYGTDAVSGTYGLPRGGGAGDLSAPRNVKAKGELNRVALMWDPPKFDGGAKIVGYTICAKYIGTLCRDVGPAGQADFRNLLSGAEYSFTVAARTAAQTGPKANANKNIKFTEASVRIAAREPGRITILAEGKGFPNTNTIRLEVAPVPSTNQPRDRWRWAEVETLAGGSRFSKTVEAELGSFYDDQTIAVRLVTPLGSVYSKASRPPR